MSSQPEPVRFADARWGVSLLHPRYWSTWLGLALLRIYSWLPRGVRYRFGGWLGEFAYRSDRRRRHYVEVNLGLCFPDLPKEQRDARARCYFRNYLRILLDLPLAWWGSDRRLLRQLEIHGVEHIEQAQARGRNVILLTGHMIGLDFGVLALSRRFAMFSVYKPFRNRVADWLVFRARTRFGLRLLAREDGLRPVIKALRQGSLLYYIPDEDLGTGHSVFAPFFGVPKASLSTLGRLARLGEADVIPCSTCFDPATRRYTVHLLPPLSDFPSGDAQSDTTRMNQALQQLVEICPAQYMWGLRFFRTRPGDEAGFYRRIR